MIGILDIELSELHECWASEALEQLLKEGGEIRLPVNGEPRFRLMRALPHPVEWGGRLVANLKEG